MYVAGLWRYPVKSLAGEALTTANLTDDGISGDRVVHVAALVAHELAGRRAAGAAQEPAGLLLEDPAAGHRGKPPRRAGSSGQGRLALTARSGPRPQRCGAGWRSGETSPDARAGRG